MALLLFDKRRDAATIHTSFSPEMAYLMHFSPNVVVIYGQQYNAQAAAAQ